MVVPPLLFRTGAQHPERPQRCLNLKRSLIRSKAVHSIFWRETPSKRKKEAWEESREGAPFKAIFEAIKAAKARVAVKAPFKAIFEAIKAAEARVEGPRPRAEGAAENPVVETRHHPVVETRMDPVRNTASPALGVNLVGSPQRHQNR
jgi:hypothetical protein